MQGGQQYPLTLDLILHSSGAEKDGAPEEHRAALAPLTAVASGSDADLYVTAGALAWQLCPNSLMAHRESARSTAAAIRFGREADAAMVVAVTAAFAAAHGPRAPGRPVRTAPPQLR